MDRATLSNGGGGGVCRLIFQAKHAGIFSFFPVVKNFFHRLIGIKFAKHANFTLRDNPAC